jgi:hypothetical protein
LFNGLGSGSAKVSSQELSENNLLSKAAVSGLKILLKKPVFGQLKLCLRMMLRIVKRVNDTDTADSPTAIALASSSFVKLVS